MKKIHLLTLMSCFLFLNLFGAQQIDENMTDIYSCMVSSKSRVLWAALDVTRLETAYAILGGDVFLMEGQYTSFQDLFGKRSPTYRSFYLFVSGLIDRMRDGNDVVIAVESRFMAENTWGVTAGMEEVKSEAQIREHVVIGKNELIFIRDKIMAKQLNDTNIIKYVEFKDSLLEMQQEFLPDKNDAGFAENIAEMKKNKIVLTARLLWQAYVCHSVVFYRDVDWHQMDRYDKSFIIDMLGVDKYDGGFVVLPGVIKRKALGFYIDKLLNEDGRSDRPGHVESPQ